MHHGFHAGIDFPHKVDVCRVGIVVEHRFEPIEGIIHDGVDVCSHRVFSPQLADGAAHTGVVKAQVIVHQVRLYGVSRPCPAVALDAVDEKFSGGQIHGVCPHLPDVVQLPVAAAEAAAPLLVEWGVFVVHEQLAVGRVSFCLYIYISEGLGMEQQQHAVVVDSRAACCRLAVGKDVHTV